MVQYLTPAALLFDNLQLTIYEALFKKRPGAYTRLRVFFFFLGRGGGVI